MQKISVVGLGKLGSCIAVNLAYHGYYVIGIDKNTETVEKINKYKTPFQEPHLQEYLDIIKSATICNGLPDRHFLKRKLTATIDIWKLRETDVTFIIVPTPSKRNGSFSSKYLIEVLMDASWAVTNKPYHLFVIVSTVSPFTTEKELMPLLDKGIGICYSPEFIALGSVMHDLQNPDFFLIGESDKKSGDILTEIYKKINSKIPVCCMSILEAEITKIALNSYITMKISFANMLGNICEKLDVNTDNITDALGHDKRISPYYLKYGTSYGGPCFPRDNRAFMKFAKNHNSQAILARDTDIINQQQIGILFKKIQDIVQNGTEGILGLSYKPNTPVIDESPSIHLINKLLKKGYKVVVYDKMAIDNTKKVFGNRIEYAKNIKGCFKSDVQVIMVNDKDYLKYKDRESVVSVW